MPFDLERGILERVLSFDLSAVGLKAVDRSLLDVSVGLNKHLGQLIPLRVGSVDPLVHLRLYSLRGQPPKHDLKAQEDKGPTSLRGRSTYFSLTRR